MVLTHVSTNSYSVQSVTANSYKTDRNDNADDKTKKTDQANNVTKEIDTKENQKNSYQNKLSENELSEKELSEKDKKVVEELKKRDAEVKAHERAHIAAGGQHTSGSATFDYQTGPNGVKYAIGGKVQIDASVVPNDPESTISKMQVIRKAALAPANPSSTDRAVAASASRKEMEARLDIQESRIENQEKTRDKSAAKVAYREKQNTGNKGDNLDIVI